MALTDNDNTTDKATRAINTNSTMPRPHSLTRSLRGIALAALLLGILPQSAHAYCEMPDGDTDGDECLTNNPAKNYGSDSPDCTINPTCTGDPINVAIGNKYEKEFDYLGKGPSPLMLGRYYNSLDNGLTALGIGWRMSYSRAISSYAGWYSNGYYWVWGTYAKVTRDDGKVLTFYPNGSGGWRSDSDVNAKLASTSTGGYVYTSALDETEIYNAAGQLIGVSNREGLQQSLSYDANGHLIAVSDAFGRSLKYSYTGSLLTSATVPDGRVYGYIYDSLNNLIKVTYPDQTSRSFLYENVSYPHALTGVIDENGSRFSTDTYDYAGRDISTQNAGGINKYTLNFSYLTYGYVPVQDALNVTRASYFTTINGVPAETLMRQSCPGCPSAYATTQRTTQYDANGNVASRVDFNGNTSCYAYDLTRNLQTVRLEGVPPGTACPSNLGAATLTGIERRIATQWNASYRLPLVVAEPLRITTYTYDAKGNLLSRSIQPTHDATGAQGSTAAATGTARTTAYTYNAAGQILTIDGPRTDVADITQYAYDAQGNLISATNALNRVTTLGAYDANGRPGSLTDPNGLVTTLSYDPRGRLISRSAGGETTSYSYDGVGNLTGVTLPGGAVYTYSYDAAHRLTRISDLMGNKLVYTLDVAGNRTKEQLFDSTGTLVQTRSRVFDALSRLYQDIGAVNQTTVYTYDKVGNLTTVTDPLNRLTSNTYDALNRLNQVTTADTGVIKYGYDGQDQLTQVSDPRNLVTQYARDGLGDLTQQTSPDTGTTTATYDAAGNLISRTDAKGQVAAYTYDALNRLTGISYSGGSAPAQTVSYQYDQGTNGIGHLTGIVDATGTVGYSYDLHGRLINETAQHYGASYTTGYAYDAQGRLAGLTYPSGRLLSYSFDSQGRINSIANSYHGQTKTLVSNIAYQPFGGVKSFTYGDGTTAPVQSYTRQIDQDGRIAGYTLNGQARLIGYDAASQIAFISDPANLTATASYAYDNLSRLAGFAQGGSNQSFGYDRDGNRTSQVIGSTATSYAYGATSNWLTGMQTGTVSQTVGHDVNGATTSDATRQYAYDARGRLIQSTTAQGVINYEVNALGLRVRKQVPYAGSDTEYHYDAQGHLIGESPAGNTKFSREYFYLGDLPVAVIQ